MRSSLFFSPHTLTVILQALILCEPFKLQLHERLESFQLLSTISPNRLAARLSY